MTAIDLSRPGQVNNSGAANALFLKVFSGEVITQFQNLCVMRPRIMLRSIPYGKSAVFPVLGKAVANVHTPGHNILTEANGTYATDSGTAANYGNKFAHNERVIAVDNKLISHTMVSDVDELQNHFDLRSKYSFELAQAIAQAFDKACLSTLHVAAKVANSDAALATGELGGGTDGNGTTIVVGATPTGQVIADACFTAAQTFDERSIPKTGRVAVVTPQMFYALIKDPTLYMVTSAASASTSTYTRATAGAAPASAIGGAAGFGNPNLQYGNANWAAGTIMSVAGFEIVVSNNIPSTDQSDVTGFWTALPQSGGNAYNKNAASPALKGFLFHESAIGGLLLRDISTETQWYPEYQATLLLAKLLSGFSWLRASAVIAMTAT